MISVVGIGNGASAIAQKFEAVKNYDVYLLNDQIERNTKKKHRLPSFDHPDEYEENIPDLKKFFANVRNRVQVFVIGSSMSSNYTLSILEQIKEQEIELFYIQPDIELLTGRPKQLEKITFNILQEYARSGLFKNITLISNLNLERSIGHIPIKAYFDSLNDAIYSCVHYLNYFEFSDPEIGQVSRPAETNRIRTVAALNVENLEEKWFFDLDTPRELCYYMCINEERLMKEGGLHKKLVDILKQKPKNAFRKISYAIYETPHKDFGFCVAHTNVVQEQKTLDSSS